MTPFLEQIIAGHDLTREQARQAMETIMSGEVPDAVIGAFLAALVTKGECVAEIVGAAEAMRARVTPVRCAADCIDTCGTGGDGISTFNVSTTAAIIAAAAGVTVAKHGNRTNTRVSGSAEVLAALGVDIDAEVSTVERCLAEVGVGFLYARVLHPAMKHAVAVRRALGVPTLFNMLGPLTNPAGARRQVLGVPRAEQTDVLARALQQLGAVRAWVVHGLDGLCDLTVTAETLVTELRDGEVRTVRIAPEAFGLGRGALEDLAVSSPQESAAAIREVLAGVPGPRRDHALLNAGAALVVAGMADDLADGVAGGAKAIDSGAARDTLATWIEVSHAR